MGDTEQGYLWREGTPRLVLTSDEWHTAHQERERMAEVWAGLTWLAERAVELERAFSSRQETLPMAGDTLGVKQWGRWSHSPLSSVIGEIPLITRDEYRFLINLFHWYSVSAANYICLHDRAYTDLKGLAPSNKKAIVNSVSPAMLDFRNKIGAHSAYHYPQKEDGLLERKAAILPLLRLQPGPRFEMARVKLKPNRGALIVSDQPDTAWQLTRVHEVMVASYARLGSRVAFPS